MKFLNKKEEIIQVKLTQYGKHLLSKGILQPVYYSFYDDNILYDAEYAGITTEHQNEAHDRIVQTTPQLEAQYIFDSVEEQVRKVNNYIRSADEENHTYGLLAELGSEATVPQGAQYHSMVFPIGTSKLDKDYLPAWDISFLNGELSSSVGAPTGSYQQAFIPQINSQPVIYKYRVVEGDMSSPSAIRNLEDGDDFLVDPNSHPNQTALEESGVQTGLGAGEFVEQFDDGNYLAIYDDSLILSVTEENTDFDKENFEIEIYKVSTQESTDKIGSNKEVLVPLYFSKKPDLVRNGILLDPEDIRAEEKEIPQDDPSYVGYFFDVLTDGEIDPKILVEVMNKMDPSTKEATVEDLYKPSFEIIEEDC
tara:strand:- start:4684 stop:5778 length:1095 start_codon:yes stop_codon:yes gene_type:complete